MTRAMLTEADILKAIRWRLQGVPAETIEMGLQSAFYLLGTHTHIQDDEKPVAEILEGLRAPSDRREPWGLLCALLAMAAHQRRNRPRFWSAGFEVWQAYLQAHRSPSKGKDQLSVLIASHITTRPDLSPSTLFDELANQADLGFDSTLADYDADQDVIVIEADGSGRLKNVGRSAFIRRVQRIRQEINFHSSPNTWRQHPANVATTRDNENHE